MADGYLIVLRYTKEAYQMYIRLTQSYRTMHQYRNSLVGPRLTPHWSSLSHQNTPQHRSHRSQLHHLPGHHHFHPVLPHRHPVILLPGEDGFSRAAPSTGDRCAPPSSGRNAVRVSRARVTGRRQWDAYLAVSAKHGLVSNSRLRAWISSQVSAAEAV